MVQSMRALDIGTHAIAQWSIVNKKTRVTLVSLNPRII
jgi:hypothetical protein